MSDPRLVVGEIDVGEGAPRFSGATVYVRLEDVGRADAPAKVIAETVIRNAGSGAPLAFVLRGVRPPDTSSCSVRVHIDVDGDEAVGVGDLITMQSYPADLEHVPERMRVVVRPVT